MRGLATAFVVLSTLPSIGAEVPPTETDLAEYAKACDAGTKVHRESLLAFLAGHSKRLRSIQTAKRAMGSGFHVESSPLSPKERKELLDREQAQMKVASEKLQRLQRENFLAPLFRPGQGAAELGALGTLEEVKWMNQEWANVSEFEFAEVVQVAGEDEMIVKMRRSIGALPAGAIAARLLDSQLYFWVRGYPTAGIVDDSVLTSLTLPKAERPTVWQVTGTRRYKTAIAGPRTIFVIEPLSADMFARKAR